VEENITERQLFGIEICDYLLKKIGRVLSNFCRVFSKTAYSFFRNDVVYLAIFVVYLATPFLYIIELI